MDKRPRVVSVECVAPYSVLQRFKVTFDMEWTSKFWKASDNLFGMWFDTITVTADDELDAWRAGTDYIANETIKWRDKDGG